jgi:hypothetical protein
MNRTARHGRPRPTPLSDVIEFPPSEIIVKPSFGIFARQQNGPNRSLRPADEMTVSEARMDHGSAFLQEEIRRQSMTAARHESGAQVRSSHVANWKGDLVSP